MNPADEAAERISKTIPAMAAAAKALGLRDHQRMLNSAANRVDDSHRLGMKQLGFDVETNGDDMGGDIFITGDINAQNPERVIDSFQGRTQWNNPTQPQIEKRGSKLANVALFAVGAISGATPLMFTGINGFLNQNQAEQPNDKTEQPTIVDESVSLTVDGNEYGLQLWKPME